MLEFLEDYLQRFWRSMKFVYPNGLQNAQQHRDVCKIYFMGALDTLMTMQKENIHLDLDEQIQFMLVLGEKIKDYNWWPDETWKWW